MEKDVAAGVGEQVEARPAVDVSPDNFMESSIQWPRGKHSQRGNKLPLFHFLPSNFLQRHPLQWSRKLRSFCLWQGAQRLALVSYCATEHNYQKDQLCQLLEDHLPCSGWRELLGGPNLTTRCGDSCQSAVEGTWLLKGLSSWLWLFGVPFISPNPQDVDCILTAIGFPSACLWCRICVLKHRQRLSHLPTFSTSMAMIDKYLTHGFVSVGAPLQICLCPSHLNFPDRIRAILKQKQRNRSEHRHQSPT